MSQCRGPKVGVANSAGTQPRSRQCAGDMRPTAVDGNVPQSSKTKNKIPKSVRYDLENALLGLCDVWFEEIKPHLVRNKIKLHAHSLFGAGAGSAGVTDVTCVPGVAGTSGVAGGGDQPQAAGAAGCSHINPGAAPDRRRHHGVSSADCFVTQPTASRVPSHRQHSGPSCKHQYIPLQPPCGQNPRFIRHEDIPRRLKRRRCQRRPQTSLDANWCEPRLCRTYTCLTPTPTPRPDKQKSRPLQQKLYLRSLKTQDDGDIPKPRVVQSKKKTRSSNIIPSQEYKKQPKLKHKSTQTEPYHPVLCVNKPRGSPPPQSKQNPSSISRRQANSSIPPNRHMRLSRSRKPKSKGSGDTNLFPDDLINAIGERHELRLLYQSPTREESQSVMNLLTMKEHPKEKVGSRTLARGNKRVPWK